MATQAELQTKLEELMGNKNVYYQPPQALRMSYDAIRYSLSRIDTRHANNGRYKNMNCYDLILITRRPDPEVLERLLDLPYSSLGKPYVSDNLYHYPITLYH